MPHKNNDPIIRGLQRIKWQRRLCLMFEHAFPFITLIILLYGTSLFLFPVIPLRWITPILGISLGATLFFSVRRGLDLSIRLVAAQVDRTLNLPDSLIAYLEYSQLPNQNYFHHAHQAQLQTKYSSGIQWKTQWPKQWKIALMFVTILFSVGLASWTENENSPKQPFFFSKADRKLLLKTAKKLKHSEAEDIAVTLERLAKLPQPDKSIEKERIIRTLKKADSELGNRENRLAKNFLMDMFRSSSSEPLWNEMTQNLSASDWSRASNLAQLSSRKIGSKLSLSPSKKEVLKALHDSMTQRRSTETIESTTSPTSKNPTSIHLEEEIMSLARNWAKKMNRHQFESLEKAQNVLKKLAGGLGDASKSNRSKVASSAMDSKPLWREAKPLLMPEITRQESVTPQILPGRRGNPFAGMGNPDTGISLVKSEETPFSKHILPPGIVPRVSISLRHKETIRRYFEILERLADQNHEE